jgi:hypothetical protein
MTYTLPLIRLLRKWRHGNAQEQRETFQSLQQSMPEHFASPTSVSTPLGHVGYRQVNPHVECAEGVRRARTRQYHKPKGRHDG